VYKKQECARPLLAEVGGGVCLWVGYDIGVCSDVRSPAIGCAKLVKMWLVAICGGEKKDRCPSQRDRFDEGRLQLVTF